MAEDESEASDGDDQYGSDQRIHETQSRLVMHDDRRRSSREIAFVYFNRVHGDSSLGRDESQYEGPS